MSSHNEEPMLVSAENPTIDKLLVLASGDLDLVNEALKAAALRGLVQRFRYQADLEDVVAYIVAKTGQR